MKVVIVLNFGAFGNSNTQLLLNAWGVLTTWHSLGSSSEGMGTKQEKLPGIKQVFLSGLH